MFTERLHTIMTALGLSPLALAREMDCDRSNIDRICKGTRVPRREGKSVRRIVEALYTFADDAGKTDVLVRTTACEEASTGEQIRAAVIAWLFEGEETAAPVGVKAEKQQTFRAFGQKLNAVMELLGLSNARLGKLLHVDSSYISRFRGGFRSPAANPRMAESLCEILLELARERLALRPLPQSNI